MAYHTLLHDTSRRDWLAYTRQLGLQHINVQQGPIFSHSAMVVQAAVHGQGIALVNNVMAQTEIEAGRLVCPFNDVLISKNSFYLVCQDSQAELGKSRHSVSGSSRVQRASRKNSVFVMSLNRRLSMVSIHAHGLIQGNRNE